MPIVNYTILKSKLKFYPFQFLVVLLLITFNSKYFFIYGFISLAKVSYFLLAFNFTGNILCSQSYSLNQLPDLLKTALNILAGGILFFLLAVIIFYLQWNKDILFYFCIVPFLLNFAFAIKFKFSWAELLTIIPFLLLLFDSTQINLANSAEFVYSGGDYFYYTAVTKSLSVNFNIYDAEFHKGIPLSYQSIAFFFPAVLSYLTGLNASTVLWAIAMPLYTVFSFSTVSHYIQRIVIFYFPDTAFPKLLLALFCSFSLILLAPLNLNYILKGQIANFIFLGEGYLLPTGSPCFALAIWFFGILGLLFLNPWNKCNTWDMVFAIIFLGLIAVTKLAFYIPILVICGMSLLLAIWKDKKPIFSRDLIIVFGGAAAGLLLFKIFFVASPTFGFRIVTDGGYFFQSIQQRLLQNGYPQSYSYIVFFTLFLVISWLGLKLLFLFLFKRVNSPGYLNNMIFICFIGVIISIGPSVFLRTFVTDENNKLLQDTSFDSMQFIRGALFLITPFIIVWLSFLIFRFDNRFIKITVFFWFFMVFISFSKLNFHYSESHEPVMKWNNSIKGEFMRINPRKMAMINSELYSCQVLVAKGVYPWWVFGKKAQGIDYVMCDKVNQRVNLLQKVLDNYSSFDEKMASLKVMKSENVDFIVATPNTKESLDSLTKIGLLKLADNSNWFYKIL